MNYDADFDTFICTTNKTNVRERTQNLKSKINEYRKGFNDIINSNKNNPRLSAEGEKMGEWIISIIAKYINYVSKYASDNNDDELLDICYSVYSKVTDPTHESYSQYNHLFQKYFEESLKYFEKKEQTKRILEAIHIAKEQQEEKLQDEAIRKARGGPRVTSHASRIPRGRLVQRTSGFALRSKIVNSDSDNDDEKD